MYAIEDLAKEADEFRAAVCEGRPFRPIYVKIKLVRGCNLKCAMCNHWRTEETPGLPDSRFFEIVEELAGLGCRKIHFTGGEPLLLAALARLVARSAELGMRVTMTTNGTLVTKTRARQLIESGLRGVNVSLDSPDRKMHDHLRGNKGAWKNGTRAISLFHRFSGKGKIIIRVNTVVSRPNYRTLRDLPDLVHDLGADSLQLIPVDGHCGERLFLRHGDISEYNNRIAPYLAERCLDLGLIQEAGEVYCFGRTEQEVRQARRGAYSFGWYQSRPCFVPWTHSLIDFDGLVYPCCMTREQMKPLGDLKHSSFAGVWNAEAYNAVRKTKKAPLFPQCKRCDDFLQENRALAGFCGLN